MTTRDESRLFDVRTVDRNLRKGLIGKKDYEKHMKSLPDAADKSTACNPEAQTRELEWHPPPERHSVAAAAPIASAPAAGPEDELDDELDDDKESDEDEEEGEEGGAKEG